MTEDQQSPPMLFDYKCPTCKATLTFSDFSKAIIQQGLILIDGIDGCWFGCTCPFCNDNTVIKNYPKPKAPEEILTLYYCILKDEIWHYHIDDPELKDNMIESGQYSSGRWEYNSFPYTFTHKSESLISFTSEVSPNSKWIHDFTEPEESMPDFEGSKISYIKGSRISEPATTILWFAEDKIEELAAFESSEKKKVFPRYSLYDSTWETMQNFCWSYKLQLDLAEQMAHKMRVPLDEYLSMSSKKRIAQAYEFLTILDQPYPFSSIQPHSQYSSVSINITQQTVPFIEPLDEKSLYSSKTRREKITKKVWDHFNKDYIQQMLLTRVDKFILDFIELSKSTSFSRKTVWDLKEKCLLELHRAISSNYQKRVEQDKDTKYWQEQAEEAEKCFPDVKILSQDPGINELKVWISKLPQMISITNFKGPILLLGEKGTGKSYFAKAIHYATQREGKFIPVDCGAITENLFESKLFGHIKGAFTGATENQQGAFEEATGGTLFLDEIGNISSTLQQKLLGVLQERRYQPVGSSKTKTTDVFIIAATNENLEQLVETGNFRGDLFDRLNQEPMTIPPLRDRKKDIPFFLKDIKTNTPINPNLGKELIKLKYDWPGNVRELISILERIARHKLVDHPADDVSAICFKDFEKEVQNTGKKEKKSRATIKDIPKGPGNTKITPEQVRHAMKNNNGNKSKAADELGVTYHTILRHCKKLGI